MTYEERKIILYCLKSSSDYHKEVCEECEKYSNCNQDDITEIIINIVKDFEKIIEIVFADDYPEDKEAELEDLLQKYRKEK